MIKPRNYNEVQMHDFDVFMRVAKKLKKDELLHILSYYYVEMKGTQRLCESYAQENFADNVWHKVASANLAENLRISLDPSNFNYILTRKER